MGMKGHNWEHRRGDVCTRCGKVHCRPQQVSPFKGHNLSHGKGDVCKKCGKTHIDGFLGRVQSDDARAKISAKLKGRQAWNISKPLSDTHKLHLSISHKTSKIIHSTTYHTNQSNALKAYYARITYEHKSARLSCTQPSSFEVRVQDVLDANHLPFTYIGDGRLWINGKNPDFKHDSLPVLIEVYGIWHKERNYEEIRSRCLSDYYVVFLPEHDVTGFNWKERCVDKILQQCIKAL